MFITFANNNDHLMSIDLNNVYLEQYPVCGEHMEYLVKLVNKDITWQVSEGVYNQLLVMMEKPFT